MVHLARILARECMTPPPPELNCPMCPRPMTILHRTLDCKVTVYRCELHGEWRLGPNRLYAPGEVLLEEDDHLSDVGQRIASYELRPAASTGVRFFFVPLFGGAAQPFSVKTAQIAIA
jgi:hypothetical protein